MSICNSKNLPLVIDLGGKRMRWVGFGWVDEGELRGDEVKVTK